ncbi:MAG: hypothetical protein OXI59_06780, partial [Gemmatimonadota bacterium]|nr:hypothetical protein [Gemmatimonadota bacterium]
MISLLRPNGPQVENGSIRVLRSIRSITNRELFGNKSSRVGECVVTIYCVCLNVSFVFRKSAINWMR